MYVLIAYMLWNIAWGCAILWGLFKEIGKDPMLTNKYRITFMVLMTHVVLGVACLYGVIIRNWGL